MKPEKQTEQELDFFQKNPVIQNIKKTKDKILPKKEKRSIGFSMPTGLWSVFIAALGLFGLHHQVEHAGWVLFLAFLYLDRKDALIPFALAALGLWGIHNNVEFAGWLIFAAFIL